MVEGNTQFRILSCGSCQGTSVLCGQRNVSRRVKKRNEPSLSKISRSVSDAIMTPGLRESGNQQDTWRRKECTLVKLLPPIPRIADDSSVKAALIKRISHLIGFQSHRPVELNSNRWGVSMYQPVLATLCTHNIVSLQRGWASDDNEFES